VTLCKEAAADKTYRALVALDGRPPPEARSRVEGLAGSTVEQYTPGRVLNRRGPNRLRLKKIVASSWLGEIDGEFLWEVRTEAGTYIKELISGDGGRTSPSLSCLLGVPASCSALDILEVHWRGPWEVTEEGC
jgi:tRNA pseudouridine synthase 10